jgi:hypothetical protein
MIKWFLLVLLVDSSRPIHILALSAAPTFSRSRPPAASSARNAYWTWDRVEEFELKQRALWGALRRHRYRLSESHFVHVSMGIQGERPSPNGRGIPPLNVMATMLIDEDKISAEEVSAIAIELRVPSDGTREDVYQVYATNYSDAVTTCRVCCQV